MTENGYIDAENTVWLPDDEGTLRNWRGDEKGWDETRRQNTVPLRVLNPVQLPLTPGTKILDSTGDVWTVETEDTVSICDHMAHDYEIVRYEFGPMFEVPSYVRIPLVDGFALQIAAYGEGDFAICEDHDYEAVSPVVHFDAEDARAIIKATRNRTTLAYTDENDRNLVLSRSGLNALELRDDRQTAIIECDSDVRRGIVEFLTMHVDTDLNDEDDDSTSLGWVIKTPNGQYLDDDFSAGPRSKASVYARAWVAGDDARFMTGEAIRRGIAPENAEYLVEQVRTRAVIL